MLGLDKRRSMPKFAAADFLKKARKCLKQQPAIKEPIERVAYFVDTFANYNDPELGGAVLKLLTHFNIEVILPKQRPAPLPAICYGDIKTARKDLAYNVKFLSEAVTNGYKIICSEPSAALCLKEDLQKYIGGDDARRVSENTFELMNFLNGLLENGRIAQRKQNQTADLKIASHSPCHLIALTGDGASKNVIEKLGIGRVDDLQAGCCGIAGTFGMQKKNYDLSIKMGSKLAAAIKNSDADYIITECSTCKMQIEHLTGKNAIHPAKLIADYILDGTNKNDGQT